MSFSPRSHLVFACTATLCAALTACGGDDGSDPIDKYLATFVGVCYYNPNVTNTATGNGMYVITVQRALSKVDAYTAYMEYKNRTYTTSNCSGPAYSEIVTSGNNTWLRVVGDKPVGNVMADLINYSMDPYFYNVPQGGYVSSNGVTYTAGFVSGGTYKDIYYLTGDGALYDGDFYQSLDSYGYPNYLTQSPVAYEVF